MTQDEWAEKIKEEYLQQGFGGATEFDAGAIVLCKALAAERETVRSEITSTNKEINEFRRKLKLDHCRHCKCLCNDCS